MDATFGLTGHFWAFEDVNRNITFFTKKSKICITVKSLYVRPVGPHITWWTLVFN